VVLLPAGGYGPESWRSLADLMRWLLCGRVAGLGGRGGGRAAQGALRAQEAEAAALPLLTEADIGALFWPREGTERRSHSASAHGVEHALERSRVLQRIRARGFSELRVSVEQGDPAGEVVRIHGDKDGRGHLLVEMVLNERALAAVPGLPGPARVLAVEWLLVQDPTARFTPERPVLPGQEHPGLGITSALRAFLVEACTRRGLDGVLSRPAHYHNAVVAARHACLLDPSAEGRLRAMEQALGALPLAEASHLVEGRALRTRDARTLQWEPSDQVLPVGPVLSAYFGSREYRERRDAARDALLDAGLAPAARRRTG
jgi:hypothetical protein